MGRGDKCKVSTKAGTEEGEEEKEEEELRTRSRSITPMKSEKGGSGWMRSEVGG